MSALPLLSVALLLAALAGCAVLWSRSGETRVGIFGALFLMLAVLQAAAPWTNWSDAFAWNFSALGRLAALAVGSLAVLAVVALWRTLAERDRAEKLHWDSMEIVRVINELSAKESASLDSKIDTLLEMGASRFELEVAMLARVRNERYEIIAIRSTESFPVTAGAVFSLQETFCEGALTSERPVGIERISESNEVGALGRAAFPFESYLGAAVTVDGARYGTLSFAGFEPRKERFHATEKDLIRLMASWIGSQIGERESRAAREALSEDARARAASAPSRSAERQLALVASIAERAGKANSAEAGAAAKSPTASEPSATRFEAGPRKEERARGRTRAEPREQERERAIDPNRILRRMLVELRALAGEAVRLRFELDPHLGFASAQNLPLKAIARTLVMNARDAMPEGGELVVETANLDITAGEPGEMPALAPDRYVTIAFRDGGREPDADALSRLFDRAEDGDGKPSVDDRLPLATIYRVLQICGGDLSVNVEPGRGSTFTVFLPRAAEPPRAARDAARADATALANMPAH